VNIVYPYRALSLPRINSFSLAHRRSVRLFGISGTSHPAWRGGDGKTRNACRLGRAAADIKQRKTWLAPLFAWLSWRRRWASTPRMPRADGSSSRGGRLREERGLSTLLRGYPPPEK